MNEDNNRPPYEDANEPTGADRPNMAMNNSRGGKGWLIAFIVFAAALMIYLTFSISSPSDEIELVEEEGYRVAGNAGQPYIATPKPEVTPQPEAVQRERPIQEARVQQDNSNELLQREAIRIAREREEKRLQRLQSKQVIVGNGGSGASEGVSGTAGSGSLSAGSDDENTSFANRHGSGDYETKKAVQLQNLHNLVPQGTMIPGILETAISSNLPGFTRATVAEDVYSYDGKALLIPTGTQLIGRYRSATVQGQDRVFVIWQRLLRPDGVSMTLDSYGTDSLGRSGLEGEVDTHFFERFGSTIMLSLIDGAIQYGVQSANDQNGQTVALNSGQNFSRAAEIALENSINIPPTIYINQGERINIFVGHDLDFSTAAKKEVKIVR